jgi:hypothetical protein
MSGRQVVVTTMVPAALARERGRLGITQVVGLPVTVEALVAVLTTAAGTSVPAVAGRRAGARSRSRGPSPLIPASHAAVAVAPTTGDGRSG